MSGFHITSDVVYPDDIGVIDLMKTFSLPEKAFVHQRILLTAVIFQYLQGVDLLQQQMFRFVYFRHAAFAHAGYDPVFVKKIPIVQKR